MNVLSETSQARPHMQKLPAKDAIRTVVTPEIVKEPKVRF